MEGKNTQSNLGTQGLRYELSEDGNSYICTGMGDCREREIVIASEYLGKPVTGIGDRAFEYLDGLTGVIIPDSVVSIGAEAFSVCPDLKTVSIPNSVRQIGVFAFDASPALRYREYGGVFYLGNATNPYLALVKAADKSIRSHFTHPQTKIIAGGAFMDCALLTGVTVPRNVEFIGGWAFLLCFGLQEAWFGNPCGWATSDDWSYGSFPLASADLSEPTKAAKYLAETHSYDEWKQGQV